MAGAFTAVDLAKLPFPNAVEVLDFETILSEMLADYQSRDPEFSALVESDPAYKVLEVSAFRELLLRQRVNEAIKAVTLAYANDADLDQIAARYNVERLLIDAGNPDAIPPVPPTYESNDSLRRRVQLSFEGFSTAGPEGAYVFHALGSDARVLDADARSPVPGQVIVAVLSNVGSGAAPSDLLSAVDATLSDEDVRPLTDQVLVESAVIVNYSIAAQLTLYPGPDADVVLAAANAAAAAYADTNHRLGRDVTLSGLYAALHREGVHSVLLTSPSATIVIARNHASYCTGITITSVGIDE